MHDLSLTREDGSWVDFRGKRNQWYFTGHLQSNSTCTAFKIYQHSDWTCQHPDNKVQRVSEEQLSKGLERRKAGNLTGMRGVEQKISLSTNGREFWKRRESRSCKAL